MAAPPKLDPLVLVVDDEKVITDTFKIIIKMERPWRVDGRYDGVQAVEYCKQYKPDVVVMGIMMPNMNGIEAVLEIQKFHPTCQFVFLSGSPMFSELPVFPENIDLHHAYLCKPAKPLDLLKTIEAVLERRYQNMKVEWPDESTKQEAVHHSLDVKCRFAVH